MGDLYSCLHFSSPLRKVQTPWRVKSKRFSGGVIGGLQSMRVEPCLLYLRTASFGNGGVPLFLRCLWSSNLFYKNGPLGLLRSRATERAGSEEMAHHKLETGLGLGAHRVKFWNRGVDGRCVIYSPADPRLSSGPVPLSAVCSVFPAKLCCIQKGRPGQQGLMASPTGFCLGPGEKVSK